MKSKERLFTIGMLAFVVVMLMLSFRFEPKSRLFPLIIGIGTCLLLTMQIATTFSDRFAHLFDSIERKPELATDAKKRERHVVIWLAGLLIAIYCLGFIASMPLFLFLFLFFWAEAGWKVSMAITVITSGVIYIVFAYTLKVPLYGGLLFN